jgi:hypothetical protein
VDPSLTGPTWWPSPHRSGMDGGPAATAHHPPGRDGVPLWATPAITSGDATRPARSVMPPPVDAATRLPPDRSRTGHPTPWSRSAAGRPNRPAEPRRHRPIPPPVFVDDSGRRRRAGRLLGACLASLVLCYVGVVGLTFSGAPLVGRLAPPGIGQLSRPAGDEGLDVGPGSRESPLPAGALAPPGSATEARGTAPGNAGTPSPAEARPTAAPTTTTASPTTTTTTTPGRGTTSSVPTPSSTVPERTHTSGGPPPEPPGKP